MQIVALAGGVGAGKFLRGVARAFPGEPSTVVVNTGDDITIHGLHVSPDLDSVCYWLADLMDRERGWGRAGETFHAMEAMRASGRIDAWFNLGDRDLVTHVVRTQLLHEGRSLSQTTAELCATLFGLTPAVIPMTDDAVTTRIDVFDRRRRAARPALPGVLGEAARGGSGERDPVRGRRARVAGSRRP